ncbi:MAG: ribosome biogenesis GTP-binding protein YihA/YsxC [Cyclobacteriaceae bacterium]|nr:ribosome biogenesis GTP-binding protein YihA/YsxC [Cyclobacteriaceae bacterium]UYN86247.1 MAG: ribosome biogenesis GTP-binding protein YihA/YsxC [Cyclobacteriaceae bacterium]
MIIREAEFVSSITNLAQLPGKKLPEFAFIGRSNVGKSSLVNMLTGRKQLAKTSAKPGKTQTINHYLINSEWYLVDLPGYGWAGVSQEKRAGFGKIIENYVTKSPNLFCLFVLIDIRLKPQPIDLSFIQWAGSQQIPLAFIYTKADKLSKSKVEQNRKVFENELLKTWEELPQSILTSSEKKTGKDDVLDFIDTVLKANQ